MIGQGQIHLDLAFIPIPPLIVWCIYELLVAKRHRPLVMGAFLGALAGAQALIDPVVLALLGVVVGVGLVAIAALNFRTLHQRFDLVIASASAIVVFGILTGYMLWEILFASGHLARAASTIDELQLYRADLLGSIVPTANQLIAPAALTKISASFMSYNVTENVTYVGVPLIVFVAAVTCIWRRQRVILISALLALVAFIFSLGSSLMVDNRNTGIPMPESSPLASSLDRQVVPARFGLVVSLFLAIALGVGADQLFYAMRSRDVQKPRIRLNRVAALMGVVVLVASFAFILPHAPFVSEGTSWPVDTTATLDAIPPGTVVLTYPYTVFPWTEAMEWQATDGMRFRITGGYDVVQGPGNAGTVIRHFLRPRSFKSHSYSRKMVQVLTIPHR